MPVALPDSVAAGDVDSVLPEVSLEDSRPGQADRPLLSATTMDSTLAARSALKAGAWGILVGAIPFVGILLIGALAVFFYRRKSGYILPVAFGARLGAAAGVVIFAIGALTTIALIAFHAQQQIIDFWMTTLQRIGANTADPQVQASIHELFTLSGQIVSCFVAVVSASVGGALAALLLRPRKPRA